MSSRLPEILMTISATLLAGIHMITPDSFLRIDSTTLLLLVIAALPWFFPWLKSIKLPGGFELELREMQKKIEQTQQVAKRAEDAAILGIRPRHAPLDLLESKEEGILTEIIPGPDQSDPWKGRFGGRSESNGRRLKASVTEIRERPGWFSVLLLVESISPNRNPLLGNVKFFLHPTFVNDKPIVPVGPNGSAELSLVSYGAFTIGLLADGGKTQLELDLAELADAPKEFREI